MFWLHSGSTTIEFAISLTERLLSRNQKLSARGVQKHKKDLHLYVLIFLERILQGDSSTSSINLGFHLCGHGNLCTSVPMKKA